MTAVEPLDPASRAVLPPEVLAALRPHLINLTQGRLSTTGAAGTTRQDVDAIFDEHLPRFLDDHGGRAPLVFWAHGGLVDEESGVRIADLQVRWWLENGVYPIHFAWESGFGDALRQIFATWLGSRGVWDEVRDRAAETAARLFGGTKIWAAMKRSAELASADMGGARYAAERLARFVAAHPGAVDLHAAGHSAGAIFHGRFVPLLVDRGLTVASLSLLAPAVRTDEFLRGSAPLLGVGLDHVAMFSMRRDFELDDTCSFGSVTFYRRSLLYLIRAALEEAPGTPVLGLEESVQADPELWRLFGPGGTAHSTGVWSVTAPDAARDSRTTAIAHGDFDGDAPTMESVARRVTGRDDVVAFPVQRQRRPDVVAGPEGVLVVGAVPGLGAIPAEPAPASGAGGVRRRALCVGIDDYPAPDTLSGCTADARAWTRVLHDLGFETETLLDGRATREAILTRLVTLVGDSRPGDVLVFQYSGHGTSVQDLDGDEPRDEALCPVDHAAGALIIDDDLAEVFGTVAAGVNLTCFLDCCHSGTATRRVFAELAGSGGLATAADVGRRPRFLTPTAALESAHRSFRARTGPSTSGRARGPESMREVTFSACRDDQLAWESGGQGDFTRLATGRLAGGIAGLSNQAFLDRVLADFGPARRQDPELDGTAAARARPLLAPVVDGHPAERTAGPGSTTTSQRLAATAALLRAAADLVELGGRAE